MQRPYIGLQFLLLVLQNLDSTQLVAGTHTAAAEHAAVHIVEDQRIAFLRLESFGAQFQSSGFGADILDQHLQLAVAVLRTGGAVLRMPCQQKLQRQHTETLDLRCLCPDGHSILCFQCTGRHHALLAFHLHDAHPAGTQRVQVLVMA